MVMSKQERCYGGQGAVPPILGYPTAFVWFGAPLNDKTTNNSIEKLRFLMQNNV